MWKSAIYSALLKYGYEKFSLDILEYCETKLLLEREQYYIDNLNPKYNISKIAGSRLGCKFNEKTKSLLRIASTGRKHTEKTKVKMKELAKVRKGKQGFFFGKNHKEESIMKIKVKNSITIKIKDLKLGTEVFILGNKQAAKYLNIGISTLRRYKKLNKLVNNRYLVSNKKAQITQLVEWTIEAGYVVGSSPALSNEYAGCRFKSYLRQYNLFK